MKLTQKNDVTNWLQLSDLRLLQSKIARMVSRNGMGEYGNTDPNLDEDLRKLAKELDVYCELHLPDIAS